MAMTVCRECEGAVSSAAKTCPHCGVATPKHGQLVTDRIGWAMIAAAITVGLYYLWTPVIEPLGTLVVLRLLGWLVGSLP